ncbi:hypothetical protein H6F88_18575 [Oculatella sp. FACHB-28]|uniref:hypothetical protein n=1 Tax=Oculatella sp. FACHB-28 TaxID=2692845 RepID=UPI001682F4AE|nr:hypothetical protein [Oculatella sp. FACHB-28]MBD2057997.1 hypothetical protein [Oculatella sp. FACHB-28]
MDTNYELLPLDELSDLHSKLVEEKQQLEWEIFNLQEEIGQKNSRLGDVESNLTQIASVLQTQI